MIALRVIQPHGAFFNAGQMLCFALQPIRLLVHWGIVSEAGGRDGWGDGVVLEVVWGG